MIDGAAQGGSAEREQFARCYQSVIKTYLQARWSQPIHRQFVNDAVQDVFVECFRHDGPLARTDRSRPGGFRPFLFGIVRNVARRLEEQRASQQGAIQSGIDLQAIASDEDNLSVVFDQAWAQLMMRRAAEDQRRQARGNRLATQRVELLRLRFQDGLPIREIAHRWGEDSALLHRQYAKARSEFEASLRNVVADHHAGTQTEIQQECLAILDILKTSA